MAAVIRAAAALNVADAAAVEAAIDLAHADADAAIALTDAPELGMGKERC